MEILTLLIPISVILMAFAAGMFAWAVDNDQFEHLDKHAFDIFEEDSGDNL
jgi:cbb3-type cytochrome oxidase maturation protein